MSVPLNSRLSSVYYSKLPAPFSVSIIPNVQCPPRRFSQNLALVPRPWFNHPLVVSCKILLSRGPSCDSQLQMFSSSSSFPSFFSTTQLPATPNTVAKRIRSVGTQHTHRSLYYIIMVRSQTTNMPTQQSSTHVPIYFPIWAQTLGSSFLNLLSPCYRPCTSPETEHALLIFCLELHTNYPNGPNRMTTYSHHFVWEAPPDPPPRLRRHRISRPKYCEFELVRDASNFVKQHELVRDERSRFVTEVGEKAEKGLEW